MAKPIMVQGTMSGAGKSLLVTALCRIFTEDGYKVAPFKSQNMALNSYVTNDGLEMGRAQVVQAAACGKEPDVRMNPVLLKPSTDTGSQVIVNGEVLKHMPAAEYYAFKSELIPSVLEAYESLAEENDIVVIEGAGSPAEINLKKDDFVNMGLAELVDAPVLLAGDIDRGGVFAQLYGTVALLEPNEKERVKGLLINKFRGDVRLLGSGLDQLKELTGVPTLGVIPYLKVKLDEEDSLAESLSVKTAQRPVDVAVLRLPKISNFTDFAPLENHPVLGLRYVESVEELGSPDLVVLPGTKSTVADLLWLRQTGLEAAILKLAARDVPVLGICGGYQMLGEELVDPEGVEQGGTFRGLGRAAPSAASGSCRCAPSSKRRRPAREYGPECSNRSARSCSKGKRVHRPEKSCWTAMRSTTAPPVSPTGTCSDRGRPPSARSSKRRKKEAWPTWTVSSGATCSAPTCTASSTPGN